MSKSNQSYSQILKSSSIVGGAQGINYIVGMIRVKLVAVLLGPSGVGLVGLYTSIITMLQSLTGLGIDSSGVRSVAANNSEECKIEIAAIVTALRRACWITGIFGWGMAIGFSWLLSKWTFGDNSHAWAIALLGATILFTSISKGQTALIQGIRRIGDFARIQIISVVLSSLVAIILYAWLRADGIVPVLFTTGGIQLAVSWHYARKVKIESVSQTWKETAVHAKSLVGLGLAFMWSALLGALVAFILRAVIIRELGLDASGVFQAAWGLSGLFAGFILGSMGADFYPRITAVAADNDAINRLVNEQTEIGILLAVPGLIGTLACAPWMIQIFYSGSFAPASELLPWFVLGIFGQVISWPMGYVLLAKGEKAWFAISETLVNLLKLGLSIGLLFAFGLLGTAVAMPILYVAYIMLILIICRRLTDFRWSDQVIRLFQFSGPVILLSFLSRIFLDPILGMVVGIIATAISGILSLRGLALRLGSDNRLVILAKRIPGSSHFLQK